MRDQKDQSNAPEMVKAILNRPERLAPRTTTEAYLDQISEELALTGQIIAERTEAAIEHMNEVASRISELDDTIRGDANKLERRVHDLMRERLERFTHEMRQAQQQTPHVKQTQQTQPAPSNPSSHDTPTSALPHPTWQMVILVGIIALIGGFAGAILTLTITPLIGHLLIFFD